MNYHLATCEKYLRIATTCSGRTSMQRHAVATITDCALEALQAHKREVRASDKAYNKAYMEAVAEYRA